MVVAGIASGLKFRSESDSATKLFAGKNGGIYVVVVFGEVEGIVIKSTHAYFNKFLLHFVKK